MNPSLQSPVSSLQSNSDVLVRVEGVSKKFCLSLKKSLWYGLQDMGRELTGRRRGGVDGRRQTVDGRLETRDGRLETAAESLQSTVRSPQSNSLGLRPKEFWAVHDVSFELKRGECLGLIGRNGAGKTTLLKMLNGLIKPDAGRIEMRGRVGALIALGAGFNPILTGRENIYVNGSVLGLSKKEIDAKLDEIIDFAEIGEFIDTPVQNYSSGMSVRLGFAVATTLEPDILLLDEVLAVGDVAFRSKCFQRIGRVIDKSCVIFVSHDPVQVSRICDECLYLASGKQIALGRTEDILEMYRNDSPQCTSERSVILDSCILSFECTPSIVEVNWGTAVEIDLKLEFKNQQPIGLALIALLEGEISVAQSDVTKQLNAQKASASCMQVILGPLQLRQGEYDMAVTILNESRKKTLVHATGCAKIIVKGNRGYGVSYQMPAAIAPSQIEQPGGQRPLDNSIITMG